MNKLIFFALFTAVASMSSAADKVKMPKVLCPLKPDPPIVIDGNISEWLTLPGGSEVTEKNILYGKAKWQNEDDLSGSFKFAWDKNYLYFMAEVVDDKHNYENVSKNLYRNDHVMIDIDQFWTAKVKGPFTDKQLLITLGPGNLSNTGDDLFDIPPENYIYYPIKKEGSSDKIDVAAQKSEDGYVIEARIAWSLLGVKGRQNMIIGIDVHFSDSDDSNSQETMSYLFPHPKGRIILRKRDKLVPLKLGNTAGK
jgi:hypothetical protein